MKPRSDLIPADSGLASLPEGSLARPALPKSTPLSTERVRAVDLDEQMDPLAVSESAVDDATTLADTAWKLAVIGVAAAAIWWLLPRGTAARPPLELPAPLQSEPAQIAAPQRAAEEAAIALLKQAAPTRALAAFRQCVDADADASVHVWRYYLQTLVDLDERAELRQRARQFLGRHPDRLEAPHFQCEAICRDDPERHRERTLPWGSRIDPSYADELDRCRGTIDDALNLLQQHDGDWPAAARTAWTDLLHLDLARLHHHAWRCGRLTFDDPHREQALTAIRRLSSPATADALALRRDIYRACRDAWPRTLGFESKKQVVNGMEWSKDDLVRALAADEIALEGLPPQGRR
jgi:hypothetical protein